MRKITISDRTLVLKAADPHSALSFKEKVEIARLLEMSKVDVIEFPAIENEKTDTLLLRTVCAFLKNSIMSVHTGVTEESVEASYNAIKGAAKPRLCVSLPVSPVQMEYTLHKKAPKFIELVKALVSKAVSLCNDVEFCAEDATRAESEVLIAALEAAVEAGAKTVTLCDSEGAMLPDAFAEFIKNIKNSVPTLNDVTLAIMCDDKQGCGAANSILAVKAGADEIKCACGESDITSFDTVANIVRNSGDKIGIFASLSYTDLVRITSQISKITGGKKASSVLCETVGTQIPESEINLTANDTFETVTASVKKLGYDLSDEDNTKVYESFKILAEKKPVSNIELDAIVASTAMQVAPAYKLVSYVINNGNIITPSAHIVMERDGVNKQAISIGDGPIDAAFLAIEEIAGHRYELDDFQIQSVTEGTEAMGSAVVKLRSNGKLYSGKGISTDILGASIIAYVNALNKIIFEEN